MDLHKQRVLFLLGNRKNRIFLTLRDTSEITFKINSNDLCNAIDWQKYNHFKN